MEADGEMEMEMEREREITLSAQIATFTSCRVISLCRESWFLT